MPLIKLAGLLIKSLSKPIASYVKHHLQDSPIFSKIMTGIGRKYQHLANFMSNSGNNNSISDSKAITLGSEIVVEGICFGIGGGILLYENQVSKHKSLEIEKRLKQLEIKVN